MLMALFVVLPLSIRRDVVSRAIAQNAADVQRRESVAGKRGEFQGDPVTLVLTPLSIRTVEGRSGDTILNDFIHHVTFSRVDDTVPGMEVFAYISCEERVNSKTCHVFGVGPGVGRHIREELKEMVRLNEAQATTGNPFTAIPGCPREVPQGQLFSKQIHRGDLTPVKVIGAGQYGEVYLAVQTARLPASKVSAQEQRFPRIWWWANAMGWEGVGSFGSQSLVAL